MPRLKCFSFYAETKELNSFNIYKCVLVPATGMHMIVFLIIWLEMYTIVSTLITINSVDYQMCIILHNINILITLLCLFLPRIIISSHYMIKKFGLAGMGSCCCCFKRTSERLRVQKKASRVKKWLQQNLTCDRIYRTELVHSMHVKNNKPIGLEPYVCLNWVWKMFAIFLCFPANRTRCRIEI